MNIVCDTKIPNLINFFVDKADLVFLRNDVYEYRQSGLCLFIYYSCTFTTRFISNIIGISQYFLYKTCTFMAHILLKKTVRKMSCFYSKFALSYHIFEKFDSPCSSVVIYDLCTFTTHFHKVKLYSFPNIVSKVQNWP